MRPLAAAEVCGLRMASLYFWRWSHGQMLPLGISYPNRKDMDLTTNPRSKDPYDQEFQFNKFGDFPSSGGNALRKHQNLLGSPPTFLDFQLADWAI